MKTSSPTTKRETPTSSCSRRSLRLMLTPSATSWPTSIN
jgi:hypothetical protein